MYELIFNTAPGSLVALDDPERSLHVGWQAHFLNDLQEIARLADLDIILATHSLDIIGDR